MMLRWVAAGILEAHKTFRRLKAYRRSTRSRAPYWRSSSSALCAENWPPDYEFGAASLFNNERDIALSRPGAPRSGKAHRAKEILYSFAAFFHASFSWSSSGSALRTFFTTSKELG